jgi:hypothetical protein
LLLDAYNRYNNLVGNVLGTAGYHTLYQSDNGGQNQFAIYIIGSGNWATSPVVPTDPIVATTLLRWGNYDVASNAVRFCASGHTGYASTCASTSEVPSGISVYPNSVPSIGDTAAGQSAMPASFYLSAKPSWWGSMPWPSIGPDVSGGNIGQCSGGTYNKVVALSSSQCTGGTLVAGLAGHANSNPAMACYLNTMGGPPDGSGRALAFSAASCYPDSSNSNLPPPSAPTNLVITVQ